MQVPIYVTTSDRYARALLPFAWLLKKYWHPHPPVIVGGFTPPDFEMPDGFRFMTIGAMHDYPINKWTDAVRRMIESQPYDLFILMLEDYWVTQPVDVDVVNALTEICNRDQSIIRMDLTADRALAGDHNLIEYGDMGGIELVQSVPGSPYHMSLMTAIWRKNLLLKILKPGWSPWDVEIDGTTWLSEHKYMHVVGTRAQPQPVKHTLAFRSGDTGELLLDELNPDDVVEMRDLGLLQGLEPEPA